nr:N-6 DNA methylase [uncultured Pedobacter sp.]
MNSIEGNLEIVESQIVRAIGVLGNESITSNDYHIVLFLLSLHKEGLLNGLNTVENFEKRDKLHNSIETSLLEHNKTFEELYAKVYHSILQRISFEGFSAIIHFLTSIDEYFLKSNFRQVFETALKNLRDVSGRFSGQFHTPISINSFALSLIELPDNALVYNPFSGSATFSTLLKEKQTYYGEEINYNTWAVGELRIFAHANWQKVNYILDNSINNWNPFYEKYSNPIELLKGNVKKLKYDLIISNPPFGYKLQSQFIGRYGAIKNAESFLLENGIEALNDKGKLIVLISNGRLFAGGSELELRKDLVNKDLLEMVVSFPGGLLMNTGIPFSIMVINKVKSLSGKVKFIDASKYVEKFQKGQFEFKSENLLRLIKADLENDDIKIVRNEVIVENDFNLSVKRYFLNAPSGITLSSLGEIIKGKRVPDISTGKVIKIRDLKNDQVDNTLSSSQIEISELNQSSFRGISESCLLLALRWKTLKPTYFEFENEEIYINPDIISFKVNESLVDPIFLINELNSNYVQEQLEAYRINSTIPFLKKEDLLKVVIKLPTLQEQKAKVEGLFELSDRILNLEQQRNELAHGQISRQFNEFASLKHTLGRPRQNILGWSKNIIRFLSANKETLSPLNKEFKNFYEIEIVEALEQIRTDINFITEVLEKGENGFVLEEFDLENISLFDLNKMIKQTSDNGYNFKIVKILLNGEDLKERGIVANKILLKTLIDNILTNASKYGFDCEEQRNEVIIELTDIGDVLLFEIKNNGKPFPKNYDKEKFITKYSTSDENSGTGLGGYDINRIAVKFNNPDWELLLNEDRFYLVKLKFQFSINFIN